MNYRISVDIAGTFTDEVVMDSMGVQAIGKALTTPERAFGGIREALDVAANEINTTLEALPAAVTFSSTVRPVPPMRSSHAMSRRRRCLRHRVSRTRWRSRKAAGRMHMILVETIPNRSYRGAAPSRSGSK
jgi:hypothetical protein